MSDDSARFLEALVRSTDRLTAIEMVERYSAALLEIEEGHGSVVWGSEGQPVGGTLWQPRVRWHVTPSEAHVFVDVRGVAPEQVAVEAEASGIRLRFTRVRERLLEGNAVLARDEVHVRTVELGVEIQPELVEASAADDILHIRCPRAAPARRSVDVSWS